MVVKCENCNRLLAELRPWAHIVADIEYTCPECGKSFKTSLISPGPPHTVDRE